MERFLIISIAFAVLLAAAATFARELSAMRRRRPSRAQQQLAEAGAAGAASTDADADDDDDDTAFAPLPRLSDAGDNEDSASVTTALASFAPDAEIDEPSHRARLFMLHAVAQSDVGRRRKHNDDGFLAYEKHGVFAVADGMGHAPAGAQASATALKELARRFDVAEFGPLRKPIAGLPQHARLLVYAMEAANKAVFSAAQMNLELEGSATTLVAAHFVDSKRRMYIAHVGDSRCYRIRDGRAELLTRDHTLGEKGITGRSAAYLRRAVGVHRKVYVDVFCDIPRVNDRYLLCSDGLSKMLTDEKIEATFTHYASAGAIAKALIERANAAGGRDNITALVVEVRNSVSRTGDRISELPVLGGAAA